MTLGARFQNLGEILGTNPRPTPLEARRAFDTASISRRAVP